MASAATAATTTPPDAAVTQHGFVIRTSRDGGGSAPPSAPPSQPPSARAAGGLGGLLSPDRPAPRPPPPPAAADDAPSETATAAPRARGELRPAEHTHLTPAVKRLLRAVARGLKAHQEPEASAEGLGGTYFFHDEAGRRVAIVKPCDEEPMAPCNPKGFTGRALGEPGLKPTVRVGEAAAREVAAYLLDRGGWARVPPTALVHVAHPVLHYAPGEPAGAGPDGGDGGPRLKLCSLQEYVPHECDTSEVGASRFSAADVHRVGILDLRLFNTDRHAGNILVRRAAPGGGGAAGGAAAAWAARGGAAPAELVPIDHGFALPEALEPPYFEWQHWPQALLPFSREELEYIASLDGAADAALLRAELPALREESLRLLQVTTLLLQRGAAAGLTLAEIAGAVARPLVGLDDEPSQLERLCAAARAAVDADAEAEADADGADALSDLDEGDDGSDGDEAEGGAAAPAAGGCDSPASASSGTQFGLEGTGSDASEQQRRLGEAGGAAAAGDEPLFSFDEDGARTPAPGSPAAAEPPRPPAVAAPRGAAEPGGAPKGGGHATPGGVVGASFSSALASDSLPASLDSLRGGDEPAARAAAAGEPRAPGAGAALPPGTYAPGFDAGAARRQSTQPRPGDAAARRRRAGRARGPPGAGGARLRCRLLGGAYPPLAEPAAEQYLRAGASSLFSGMAPRQWGAFLAAVGARVDAALASGAWRHDAGAGRGAAPPASSCPRF